MNFKIVYKKILLVCILALGYFACLDEIPLANSENTLDRIMIRGKLSYGTPSMVSLAISDLSDFSPSDSPVPIVDAIVLLKSANGEAVAIPMTTIGSYELAIPSNHPTMPIEIGQSYQVTVQLPNNRNYESTLEPLIGVPAIKAVHKNVIERPVLDDLENIESRLFLEITLDTPLELPNNPNRSFLKWEFEGTYRFPESAIATEPLKPVNVCYNFDPLNLDKVVVFDGNQAAQPILNNHFLLEEPLDFRFYRGFYLKIVQQSLSEGAFKYWKELNTIIDRDGSFFETLPAIVRGNFKQLENPAEIVFGYFYTTMEDSIRIFISQDEAEFPTPMCREVADRETFNSQPNLCRNCLLKAGSTVNKPDFWIN